jgi:sterol desaturase/sphingolipid hydroxylase (fatty acid hydroxylase superfamily)
MALYLTNLLRPHIPYQSLAPVSFIQAKIILTLYVFLISDLLRFIQHVFMHKFLWKLHKTHHSAEILTPLTLYRTHPIEALISFSRNTLTHALTLTFMVLILKNQVDVYDFLGVNILGFLFNSALANLRHSSIPISFGIFEYVFISPRMHQIHHSNNAIHFNKNYGVALAVWDQLIGSFYRPKDNELKNVTFGVLS